MPSKVKESQINRWKRIHVYYQRTGFYNYLSSNLKKALLPILIFIVALVIVNEFVININDLLILLTKNYSDTVIFTVFFISESFLGLIPPDIFIAWTKNTSDPILYLSILALLSFLGGIVAYLSGKAMLYIPKFKKYMQTKASVHIANMRKWGGFLIVVGALLPLPFAIASFAAGMIRFPFKNFILFATTRFLRYVIYGYAIFSIM